MFQRPGRIFSFACLLSLSCSGSSEKPPPDPGPYDDVPASETLTLQGADGPIDIVRDEHGVPHVYAGTVRDLGIGFGYAQASDRLAQMDLFRHVASGTIAELFGALQPAQIDNDIRMRMHRMRPLAEQAWAELQSSDDPDDQEMVRGAEGFADGVNLFIDRVKRGEVVLDETVQVWFNIETTAPWTPVDSLTIGRMQTWALSYIGDEEIRLTRDLQIARERFDGADPGTEPDLVRRAGAFFDVLRVKPMDTTSTIDGFPNYPDDGGTRAKPGPQYGSLRPEIDLAVLDSALHTLIEDPVFGLRIRDKKNGSNNWIVGPSMGGGNTLLANDTHLPLNNPPIWYMVHLQIPGEVNVEGVAFPGTPVVLLGHNEHIAWGATVVFHDTTDVYAEEVVSCAAGDCTVFEGGEVPIETWNETIGIGARGTITDTLNVTYELVPHHGPIIPTIEDHQIVPRQGAQALSVKFPGYDVTHDVRAFWKMNRAATVAEAFDAMSSYTHGAMNWVIIDDQGGYGWTSTARIPWRTPGCFTFSRQNPDGVAPYLVLPGDGTCEWEGWMDERYMPHAINPDKGYIATANADPVGETFDGDALNGPMVDGRPLYAGTLYDPGFRVGRITRRLEALKAAGTPITMDDMASIQADTYSNFGARVVPPLLAALTRFDEERTTPGTHPELTALVQSMTAAQLTRLDEAQDRLAAWTFETPAAVGNAAKGEIDDSVATTIFNAWQVRYVGNVIGDELAIVGESPEINVVARAVLAMIEAPEELVSGVAPETGEALLCDDLDSPGNVESCTYWMIRSLDEALDWATNEGFSSPNMDDWRWGYLHTLTLESMLPTDDLDVPPPDDPAIPGGYPRHGDNYSVDSSDPGNSDFDFSYGHGPAIRHVTEFTGPGEMRTWFTIPGGQTFDRSSPHYRDQMDLYWSVNEYFEMPFTIEDIKTVAEDRIRIEPLAVGGQ